jgi:hypothetical protein
VRRQLFCGNSNSVYSRTRAHRWRRRSAAGATWRPAVRKCQAAAVSLALFLLPGGRPRRLMVVIHDGGRPRRRPRPCANRSSVKIASSICCRSWRKSASIFKTSIGILFPLQRWLLQTGFVLKNEQWKGGDPGPRIPSLTLVSIRFQEICSVFRTKLASAPRFLDKETLAGRRSGQNWRPTPFFFPFQ